MLSTFLISFNDVGALLKYFGFVTWSFYTLVFLAVIITRRRNPEIERTFSVPIVIPFLMVFFGSYLVINVFYTVSKLLLHVSNWHGKILKLKRFELKSFKLERSIPSW